MLLLQLNSGLSLAPREMRKTSGILSKAPPHPVAITAINWKVRMEALHFPSLSSPGCWAFLLIHRGQLHLLDLEKDTPQHHVSSSSFFFYGLSLIIPLPFTSCCLSGLSLGKDTQVPMESRDAAEGVSKREFWMQTFPLVLYLAKVGCRVSQLPEGGMRHEEEGKFNLTISKEERSEKAWEGRIH